LRCNSDGIWNGTGDSLTLKSCRFFYEPVVRILAWMVAVGWWPERFGIRSRGGLHRKMEQLARQQRGARTRPDCKDIHDDWRET